MRPVYYIQYEVRPAPDSEHFLTIGGAYANCLVSSINENLAQAAAQDNFKENGWVIVTLEDGPFLVDRTQYEDAPEWLEYFETAVNEGECYVYHQWPPEAQDDDAIH